MKLKKYIDIGASIAEDCSIHNTEGYTYSGIFNYENSPYGSVAVLNGSNYIQTTEFQQFIQNTGIFTISFRAKRDATNNTDYVFSASGLDGGGDLQGWFLYFNSSDYIYINIFADGDTIITAGLPLTGVTSTDWNTYSVVGDGTNINLYVNGIAKGQMGSITTANLGGTQHIAPTIGFSSSGMKGLIADVIICDWVWETNEITNFVNGAVFDKEQDIYVKWPLDSDSSADDESWKANNGASGYGFDGTVNGGPSLDYNDVTSSPAIKFTGSEDISLASDIVSSLDGKSELTFSAWVKPNGAGTIIDFIASGDAKFRITYKSNQSVMVTVTTSSGNSASNTSNIQLNDGVWNNLIAIVDLTNDVLRIFINGTEDDATYALTGEASFDDRGTAGYIGNDGSGDYFSGSVSDLKIYESVLTISQIKEVSNYCLGC